MEVRQKYIEAITAYEKLDWSARMEIIMYFLGKFMMEAAAKKANFNSESEILGLKINVDVEATPLDKEN